MHLRFEEVQKKTSMLQLSIASAVEDYNVLSADSTIQEAAPELKKLTPNEAIEQKLNQVFG